MQRVENVSQHNNGDLEGIDIKIKRMGEKKKLGNIYPCG